MNEISIEILRSNHLEHFKIAKDLSLILPLEHPKRREIEKSMNEILDKIHKFEKNKSMSEK